MSLNFSLTGSFSKILFIVDEFQDGIGWIAENEKGICLEDKYGTFNNYLNAQQNAMEWFRKREKEQIELHDVEIEHYKFEDQYEMNRK